VLKSSSECWNQLYISSQKLSKEPMSGSVILTGANGSSGLHAATHLFRAYPELTAILTVRSAADTDVNTNTLRAAISNFPNASVYVHEVDLADLAAVHKFTTTVADNIAAKKYPPLKAIICNAFYWNLIADRELTVDGIDKTMQVGFVAHAHLVLRLLDHFDQEGGRVEMVSSVAHFRVSNPMTQYVPGIPADLDELVHPQVDENRRSHGALRYANSKLVATIWAYALDRYLQNVSQNKRRRSSRRSTPLTCS
jgi:NAD(P)-dependent dehydrogenase (short-subunit alcohol dehydrogenase family)